MNTSLIPAMNIVNGDVIVFDDGETFHTVTAAHYSGPIDGSGVTTLEYIGGDWHGNANTLLSVARPEDPFSDAYEMMTDIATGIDDLVTWSHAEMRDVGLAAKLMALSVAYRTVFTHIDSRRQVQPWYKQAALLEGGM